MMYRTNLYSSKRWGATPEVKKSIRLRRGIISSFEGFLLFIAATFVGIIPSVLISEGIDHEWNGYILALWVITVSVVANCCIFDKRIHNGDINDWSK